MGLQQLVFAFALVLLFMSWYSTSTLRNKLYVTYWNVSGDKEEFFVRITSRYVFIRGRRFNVIKKCCAQLWYKRGIHFLFPTKITTAEYVWSSDNPVDPDTGRIFIMSPEARNSMNQEERFVAYSRAQQKVAGKKESALTRYLPLICIGITLIAVVFLWQQMQMIGK